MTPRTLYSRVPAAEQRSARRGPPPGARQLPGGRARGRGRRALRSHTGQERGRTGTAVAVAEILRATVTRRTLYSRVPASEPPRGPCDLPPGARQLPGGRARGRG